MKGASRAWATEPLLLLPPQPRAGALYIFTDKSKNLYSLCGSTLVSLQVPWSKVCAASQARGFLLGSMRYASSYHENPCCCVKKSFLCPATCHVTRGRHWTESSCFPGGHFRRLPSHGHSPLHPDPARLCPDGWPETGLETQAFQEQGLPLLAREPRLSSPCTFISPSQLLLALFSI